MLAMIPASGSRYLSTKPQAAENRVTVLSY